MTNYSSQLSQHFLSPWPDVCEVWGLTLKRVGAASLLPWVCAALSLGCFLRLVTFTPLLSTLGTPLPTPRALGGLPPPQGTVPAALIFLGTLDSQLGLLDSRSPLGSSWAPPHSSILQTLSGQTRDAQDRRGTPRTDAGRSGPLSCCPLRDDAPWVTNAQSLESRCFMWLVCWWFCSWWFLMGR